MSTAAISADEFDMFKEFFYRKTGIRFEASKRYFVDKRLLDRIDQTDSAGFQDYFSRLRFESSGSELQQLINALTVNETYFFREEYQFQCLVNSILPEIVQNRPPSEPIRIWTVPSSSGEEAYTIAMCLLERWRDITRWDVEIFASDIDTNILVQARTGLYSSRSVQGVPANYLRKYFRQKPDGYQVSDELRSAVEFTRVNIKDAAEMRAYRDFDVIFCRNLLIYFDDLSRKEAVEGLYEALRPGGFILLGHSESMSRMTSLFKLRKLPDAIVYQRPQEMT